MLRVIPAFVRDLKVGDRFLSCDGDAASAEIVTVSSVVHSLDSEIVELMFSNGFGPANIAHDWPGWWTVDTVAWVPNVPPSFLR